MPILLGGRATGLIKIENHERENAFAGSGRAPVADPGLQLSVALENARLFDETNQRAAELAIINSVQEGLAAELNIQAIYDLVGDKIQQIFDAQAVLVVGYDESTKQAPFTTIGKRECVIIPIRGGLSTNFMKTIIQRREVLVFNENAQEQINALGAGVIPGTEPAQSAVFVPLISGERVLGAVSLQNLDREHAFINSESDVRLLTTLANSMSVALENARLFDETQSPAWPKRNSATPSWPSSTASKRGWRQN